MIGVENPDWLGLTRCCGTLYHGDGGCLYIHLWGLERASEYRIFDKLRYLWTILGSVLFASLTF
jgi:hypothetical protein